MLHRTNPTRTTVFRTDTFLASAAQEGLDQDQIERLVRHIVDHRDAGHVVCSHKTATVRRLPWKKRLEATYVLDESDRIYLIAVAPLNNDGDPPGRRRRLKDFLERLVVYGLLEGAKWALDKILRLRITSESHGRADLGIGATELNSQAFNLGVRTSPRVFLDTVLSDVDHPSRDHVTHLSSLDFLPLSSNVRLHQEVLVVRTEYGDGKHG